MAEDGTEPLQLNPQQEPDDVENVTCTGPEDKMIGEALATDTPKNMDSKLKRFMPSS